MNRRTRQRPRLDLEGNLVDRLRSQVRGVESDIQLARKAGSLHTVIRLNSVLAALVNRLDRAIADAATQDPA